MQYRMQSYQYLLLIGSTGTWRHVITWVVSPAGYIHPSRGIRAKGRRIRLDHSLHRYIDFGVRVPARTHTGLESIAVCVPAKRTHTTKSIWILRPDDALNLYFASLTMPLESWFQLPRSKAFRPVPKKAQAAGPESCRYWFMLYTQCEIRC